jgi:hypothetical protein
MFWILILLLFLYWLIRISNKRPGNDDKYWLNYIASFKDVAKTSRERKIIDTILHGGNPKDVDAKEEKTDEISKLAAVESMPSQSIVKEDREWPVRSRKQSQPLDGTLLLLYFGAFLFVTAVGLFVAFASLSGTARTLLVLLTMAVMYFGGFWLHNRNERLKPAGVAFVAIGMAIAPLVGVAAYHYMTSRTDGPAVWFITSVLCVGMYAYALHKIRTTFISYLFIFSFLSLFESAVSIVDSSVQYYAWGLILAGMALRLLKVFQEDEIKEASSVSAHIIVPLAILASLYMYSTKGAGQLSISLLLSAFYYTLEAWSNRKQAAYFAPLAQVLYIVAASVGIYTLAGTAVSVAATLIWLAAVQAVIIWWLAPQTEIARNIASIAFLSAVPSIFLPVHTGSLMAAAAGTTFLLGTLIAVRQKRVDAYMGAALALIALPFIAGQLAIKPALDSQYQSILSFAPVFLLLIAMRRVLQRTSSKLWADFSGAALALAGLAAIAPAWLHGGWQSLFSCLVFSAILFLAADFTKDSDWWASAGFVAALPAARELGNVHTGIFSAAVLCGLLINIVVTLICRVELNRWLVTGLALLSPLALGAGGLGFKFAPVLFSYTYLVAMAGLIAGRSIARGQILISSNVPLISFYKSTSLSYVVGYASAASLAVITSLYAPKSALHTSIILAILIVVTIYVSEKIEKNKKILAVLPWLVQALLVSAIRPGHENRAGNLAIITGSLLAVIVYIVIDRRTSNLKEDLSDVRTSSLVAAYLPVFLMLFYDEASIVPPLALGIAGSLTLYYSWKRPQAEREASGGIIALAIMWMFYVLGVRNIQFYSHVIAAVLGLYAYWRYTLGDEEASNSYLSATFLEITVPLILQALSTSNGTLYGWWLLLEEVGIMLLGITIQRRFLALWAVYVAIGAVLYQLRHLGWAALSLLALFIIGMAIYRLQKADHQGK